MNIKIQRFACCWALLMMVFLTSVCGRNSQESAKLTPHGRDALVDAREVLEQPIPKETNAKIAQALRVAGELKQLKGDSDVGLNTCTLALEQSQFTGCLARA